MIHRSTQADPWLEAHQPRIDWRLGGVPPAEVASAHPIVQTSLSAVHAIGRSRLGGLDNWHDGATLTLEAGIPAVCLGPGDIHLAHTTDEYVPIRELVACTQAIAITAMRYCGVRPVTAISPPGAVVIPAHYARNGSRVRGARAGAACRAKAGSLRLARSRARCGSSRIPAIPTTTGHPLSTTLRHACGRARLRPRSSSRRHRKGLRHESSRTGLVRSTATRHLSR